MLSLRAEISDHLDDNRRGERLREGLAFAITGAPNVGKSSLMNALAGRDVAHGLQVTLEHFTTRPAQHRALDILQFKLDILWTMLDAIEKVCLNDRQPFRD
jgi:tRNA U34 5-carboxymethylaminomethyl modifying GTPase MnmE/TrmE